ncbi:MAG: outer membrane lipoprotein-sorting protein [unclassified Hahellaceae]|nr:outer membrane lipoprotein-sorting protein [Hahellaceae bacterium]|tara:strand:+ start:47956 stop:48801 length:846 start_codon:yes stop_codon:yes gene_type:complete
MNLKSAALPTLKTSTRLLLAALTTAFAASSMAALSLEGKSAEEKGLAIAQEAERRDEGWSDSKADMIMVLKNKGGRESRRELRVMSLEVPEDGDKSLTIFDSPRDVAGTALLTHSHKIDTDDQWLYLPALKRVKRIASNNKSGPFVGSEFAFEDLSSQEVEKFSYQYLRNEACPGADTLDCYVVERDPVDENSGYTKQVAWIDTAEFRVHKVDFYDRKEKLLKTLSVSNFKQYLDQYWRGLNSVMENHQTGKSTSLELQNLEFKTGLTEQDFTENSLKRAR